MSHHATLEMPAKKLWGGGTSPFGASYGKLMMWFFLLSDAFSFSSLLISLGYARHVHEAAWPVVENVFYHFPFLHHTHLPLLYVGLMTFILIISSVTMVLAVDAGHTNNKKGVLLWLGLTIIGGLIFLGSQAWEWYTFIVGNPEGKLMQIVNDEGQTVMATIHGANLQYNEYGHTLFANFFFFITGFHGFHVFSGVVINAIIWIQAYNGVLERRGHYEMVEKAGLYWHFVDLVWVFVFTFFYLL
jgi:cytochrome c oxidase subunit 3